MNECSDETKVNVIKLCHPTNNSTLSMKSLNPPPQCGDRHPLRATALIRRHTTRRHASRHTTRHTTRRSITSHLREDRHDRSLQLLLLLLVLLLLRVRVVVQPRHRRVDLRLDRLLVRLRQLAASLLLTASSRSELRTVNV